MLHLVPLYASGTQSISDVVKPILSRLAQVVLNISGEKEGKDFKQAQ